MREKPRAIISTECYAIPCHVKPVNAEFRSKWQAEKAAAKEAQKQRRDQELDDRRAQTAALMALAMGVVSRLESGEREKE